MTNQDEHDDQDWPEDDTHPIPRASPDPADPPEPEDVVPRLPVKRLRPAPNRPARRAGYRPPSELDSD